MSIVTGAPTFGSAAFGLFGKSVKTISSPQVAPLSVLRRTTIAISPQSEACKRRRSAPAINVPFFVLINAGIRKWRIPFAFGCPFLPDSCTSTFSVKIPPSGNSILVPGNVRAYN